MNWIALLRWIFIVTWNSNWNEVFCNAWTGPYSRFVRPFSLRFDFFPFRMNNLNEIINFFFVALRCTHSGAIVPPRKGFAYMNRKWEKIRKQIEIERIDYVVENDSHFYMEFQLLNFLGLCNENNFIKISIRLT